jgi:hypothetical protein
VTPAKRTNAKARGEISSKACLVSANVDDHAEQPSSGKRQRINLAA